MLKTLLQTETAEQIVFAGNYRSAVPDLAAALAERTGENARVLAQAMLKELNDPESLQTRFGQVISEGTLVVKVAGNTVLVEEYLNGRLYNSETRQSDDWRQALLDYCLDSAKRHSESRGKHLTSTGNGALIKSIGGLFTRSQAANDLAYRLFPNWYKKVTKKLESQYPQLRQIRMETYSRAAR